MPELTYAQVFPVKALDPEPVESVRLNAGGLPELDRTYAMFDADDEYVNGKNERGVHRLRSDFDADAWELRLREQGDDEWTTFDPDDDRGELEAWLAEFFGYEVTVRRDDELGYPDDTNASGPTLISSGTLETIASWFDGLDAREARRRFRPNFVIDAHAFWEDRLYGDRGETVPFTVGGVDFEGVNPCQRCVVPTRDPETGEQTPGFQARFVEKREATLPDWVNRDWFDHFYRVMVNTRVPGAPAEISVGDAVEVTDEVAPDAV